MEMTLDQLKSIFKSMVNVDDFADVFWTYFSGLGGDDLPASDIWEALYECTL